MSSPTMHGDEQRFVQEAFETNWVAPLGPNVNAFEKEMTEYTGCGYAAALSSGTAAIHMALRLLGVKQGDVVFVSDLTFSASCNPIVYENGTPVFIDAEPDTWNMSPQALKRAYEKYPNPKAVICVHLYGTPAKLTEIMEICKAHGTPLIEDNTRNLWEAPIRGSAQVLSENTAFIPLTGTRLLLLLEAACLCRRRKMLRRR